MRTSLAGSRNRGITLIEMMVVVAIIGTMVAVSAPSLSAGLDSIRLSSATSSIASFVNAAVNRAERRQVPIELVISPKNATLSMYSNEPESNRELKLPDGIRIEAVLPRTNEPDYRLVLMPGTAVPGIGIQVANSHGGRRIVRLDPMTGFPRVESVNTP